MNATANTGAASNYSPLNKAADALVESQDKVENASRALLVILFPETGSFSSENIAHVFSDPKKKVERLDETYAGISPKYDSLCNKIAALLFKKENDKDAFKNDVDGRFSLQLMQAAQRSHRIHIERVLKALFVIRVGFPVNDVKVIATDVSAPTHKRHVALEYAKGKTSKGKDKYGDVETSMAVLIREGDKALRENGVLPKKASATSTANPAAESVSNAAKALAAELSARAAADKRKPMSDESDETEGNMEVVLRELFASKFFDGDVFDRRTFDAWMNETFAAKKQEAAKVNAGTKEEKAA